MIKFPRIAVCDGCVSYRKLEKFFAMDFAVLFPRILLFFKFIFLFYPRHSLYPTFSFSPPLSFLPLSVAFFLPISLSLALSRFYLSLCLSLPVFPYSPISPPLHSPHIIVDLPLWPFSSVYPYRSLFTAEAVFFYEQTSQMHKDHLHPIELTCILLQSTAQECMLHYAYCMWSNRLFSSSCQDV